MLEMKDIIFKFLTGIAEEIKREQIAQGKNVTGVTAQSIEVSATDTTGVIEGSISALALETGRKPGNVPFGFKDIIRKWIDDKGIFQSESDVKKNSIAFLIARKISQRGTLTHIQGGKSGVLSNVITNEKFKVFNDNVLSLYGREIRREIITSFGGKK
jgi:hypothetical protein